MQKIRELYFDIRNIAKRLLVGKLQRCHIISDEMKKKKKERLLLVVNEKKNSLLTISQTIHELVKYSDYNIDILNICNGVPNIKMEKISLYKGVVLHNTVSYGVDGLWLIYRRLLRKYKGIKILIKQDEHYETNLVVEYVRKCEFDLVLTIWDEQIAKRIYDPQETGKPHIMSYLTGYVPNEYRYFCDSTDRKIDVGYRGSIQPLIFGKLCWEKKTIGELFRINTRKYRLTYDISNREEDRLKGEEWIDFLKKCKAVLAVESGSSIVDRTGNVRKEYNDYLKHHPNATEEEILKYLEKYENGLTYYAISPRHFEAAACRTLQIMFEGEFQGIFKPYYHYVPLKRDFSNIEEVMSYVLDANKRKTITECAFNEIIMNDKYSYKSFVANFDIEINKLL